MYWFSNIYTKIIKLYVLEFCFVNSHLYKHKLQLYICCLFTNINQYFTLD